MKRERERERERERKSDKAWDRSDRARDTSRIHDSRLFTHYLIVYSWVVELRIGLVA